LDSILKAKGSYEQNKIQIQSVLLKEMGKEWVEKCERSLILAKRLGNIYTGSLYNGLLSLICDTSINLVGKTILMFSYGSGCAASMFVLRVNGDYSKMQAAA
jgi:hydroxymethylglutaryl-CoA synthase